MIGLRRISTQLGYLSADDLGKPIEVGGTRLGTLVKVTHHTDRGQQLTTVTTLDAERLRREEYPTGKPAVVTYGGGR